MVWFAKLRFSTQEIGLFVAAFGATGHHLPGMMRAYGDRDLFARFKWRFILSPLFLLTVCIAFTVYEWKGLTVVVLIWGFWHSFMQVYGFVRIYDAKVKSFAWITARLDWLLCFFWFGAGLVFSPGRMGHLFETYYAAGGPTFSPGAFHAFQWIWAALTGLVTVGFFLNLAASWRSGQAPSPIKLVLLVTSIAFWWYAMVGIHNIILGVAMFEIFHDVQYLAIVWFFNRQRIEKGARVDSFTRFLFRRNGMLIGVYVGLVFSYGYLSFLPETLARETLKDALTGFLIASTLLHFYYDGFIWKVRERSTGSPLGIAQGTEDLGFRASIPAWAVHGGKWAFFLLPLAILVLAQSRAGTGSSSRIHSLAELVPDYAKAQAELGLEWAKSKDFEKAAFHLSRAIELNPEDAGFHLALADSLRGLGQDERAVEEYRRTLQMDPDRPGAHCHYANFLNEHRRTEEAKAEWSREPKTSPDFPEAQYNLAILGVQEGRVEEGLNHWRLAIQADPFHLPSLRESAWVLVSHPEMTADQHRLGLSLAERAVELTGGKDARTLRSYFVALALTGDPGRASEVGANALKLAEVSNPRLAQDIRQRLDALQESLWKNGL
jgi:tetratricopeptide (TPR) repeat protein